MNTALQPGRRKIGTHCNQAAVKLEPLWNQAGAEPGQTVSVTVLSLALSPLLGLHSLQESKDSYSPLTPHPHFPISFLFGSTRRPDFPRGVGVALGSQVDSLIIARGGVFFFGPRGPK